MVTKLNPGKFDCYNKALPDEPTFTLLARDPMFATYIRMWADQRELAIQCGDRPPEDMDMVIEARRCASDGETWRKVNNGKWRQ